MSVSTCKRPSLAVYPIVRHIVGTTLSFESAFVLFIYAGLYKGDPRFRFVPIDLTLLFGVIAVLAGIHVILRHHIRWTRKSLLAAYLGCLLFLWMQTTSLWSPAPGFAMHKAVKMIPLVLASFLMSVLVIAPEPARVKRFQAVIVILANWIALEAYIAYSHRVAGTSLMVMSGDYIAVGRVLGLAWLIVYASVLSGTRNRWAAAMKVGLLFYLGFGILIVGSRQALVAVSLAALLPMANVVRFGLPRGSLTNRFKYAAAGILLLCLFVILGMRIADVEMNTLDRLALLFSRTSPGKSVETRVTLMSWAIEGWKESPFIGRGLGAFGALYPLDPGVGAYPHNILLELLFEGGIIGLALFLSLVVCCVVGFQSGQQHAYLASYSAIPLLVAFAGVCILVSSTYAEERGFFSLLGLLCSSPIGRSAGFHGPKRVGECVR